MSKPPAGYDEREQLIWQLGFNAGAQQTAELRSALAALLRFCDELCVEIGVSKHYPSAERARKLLP